MSRYSISLIAPLLLCSQALCAPPPSLPADRTAVRELRLGVICYGGISLAIYMFGVTRELDDLTLASTALECDAGKRLEICGQVAPGTAWNGLSPSAQEYYRVLVDLWVSEGVRTQVVIDVISGTSAGGINGIILAKALAYNRSIGDLRHLWFEEADIARLATGKPWQLHAAWRLLHGESALGGNRLLKQLKLAFDGMDAAAPGQPPRLPSLLQPGQTLDLLVTATDFYGSERLLEIGEPPSSWESRHDHVFRFLIERPVDGAERPSDFDHQGNVALAFAARSSSSFPVAFPAIRLSDLDEALGEHVDREKLARQLFPEQLAERSRTPSDLVKQLFLVDGGVLDNHPFGIAYRRISRRASSIETRRVFAYLEPAPRFTPAAEAAALAGAPAGSHGAPNAFQMFLGGESSIPSAQPIANGLIDIVQHNEQVARIVDIVRGDEKAAREEHENADHGMPPSIAARVERALKLKSGDLSAPSKLAPEVRLAPEGAGGPPPPPPAASAGCAFQAETLDAPAAPGEIRGMREAIEEDARKADLPMIEEAYLRLRVRKVVDQLAQDAATAICDVPEEYQGPRLSLLHELMVQWATRRGLIGSASYPVDGHLRDCFLHAYDLGYLRRNLRFVGDWLNAQFSPARYHEHDYRLTPAQALEARQAIAVQVEKISQVLRGNRLAELGLERQVAAVKQLVCAAKVGEVTPDSQAEGILRDHSEELDALLLPRKASSDNSLASVLLKFQGQVLGDLYTEFVQQTSGWTNPEAARAVLARYLGFPYWDRTAYPYTAYSGMGDLASIDVIRFSPNDTLEPSRKGVSKLSGSKIGHFGAFFDRDGRERDYVWGRLDGAERVLTLLRGKQDDPPESPRLQPLLHAILGEEAADRVVKPANLKDLEACLDHPGTC